MTTPPIRARFGGWRQEEYIIIGKEKAFQKIGFGGFGDFWNNLLILFPRAKRSMKSINVITTTSPLAGLAWWGAWQRKVCYRIQIRERDDLLSVHKDRKRGTWYVKIKYTDWTGEKKETTRRGFAKKKDAQLFEQDFHRQKQGSHSMSFKALYDLYMEDIKPRIRPTTYRSKEYMFTSKVLPFFANLPCDQITPAKIRQWQNELVKGDYQETYLLSTIKLQPSSTLP